MVTPAPRDTPTLSADRMAYVGKLAGLKVELNKIVHFLGQFEAREIVVDKQRIADEVDAARDSKMVPKAPPTNDPSDDMMEETQLTDVQNLCTHLQSQVEANPDFFGKDGFQLCVGLEKFLEQYGRGPFSTEKKLVQNYIKRFVVEVFAKIQEDSSNHALLMSDYKDQISRLAEKARECSEKLGADRLVPNRLSLEQERNRAVMTLIELHNKRKQTASKPSGIQELLKGSLAEFEAKQGESISKLLELQMVYVGKASDCRSLISEQESYKQRRMDAFKRQANNADRVRSAQVNQLSIVIDDIQAKLREATDLLEEMDHNSIEYRSAQEGHDVVDQLMMNEIAKQGMFAKRYDCAEDRFSRGAHLLRKFGDWLTGSYDFLQTLLLAKREAIKKELPEDEKRFCQLQDVLLDDLSRRIDEQHWAINEMVRSRDQKEQKAAVQERVPAKGKHKKNQVDRALKLKEEVEDMDDKIRAMEAEAKELKTLYGQILEQRQGAESNDSIVRGNGALEWAQSFFYNATPGDKRARPSLPHSFVGDVPHQHSGKFQRLKDYFTPERFRKRVKAPATWTDYRSKYEHESRGEPPRKRQKASWDSDEKLPASLRLCDKPLPQQNKTSQKSLPWKKWW